MSSQNNYTDRKSDIVSSYKPPFNKSKEEVWNEMITKIENKSGKTSSNLRILNKKFYYAVASLLVFLAITLFVADKSYKTYYVENGAKQEVILPDNSVVLINSDSHLSYSKLAWNFKRKIKLDGEAYFKVTPGKKFNVITSIAQVRVLGTEFNTYSRENVFETKCFSGKVQVKNKGNEIILTKGNACRIDKRINENNQFSFDYINNKDWREGVFFFKKQSLSFVFNELRRQFNVEIILPESVKDRLYTGYFSNQDLEDALKTVCLPMQLGYKINHEKTIIINEM